MPLVLCRLDGAVHKSMVLVKFSILVEIYFALLVFVACLSKRLFKKNILVCIYLYPFLFSCICFALKFMSSSYIFSSYVSLYSVVALRNGRLPNNNETHSSEVTASVQHLKESQCARKDLSLKYLVFRGLTLSVAN